jgi:toxin FitB
MIILDTNVVSEPMKPTPDPRVDAWLNDQLAETMFFTSVGLAELLVGMELLPDGKRKSTLLAKVDRITNVLFADRVLPFDNSAAIKMAQINKVALSVGYNVTFADAQIAAIAALHGYSVATRDEGPFRAMGLAVINPWTA